MSLALVAVPVLSFAASLLAIVIGVRRIRRARDAQYLRCLGESIRYRGNRWSI